MYPNTTAKNFIARHVFIVSHPLQGHHQRYSSEPEIPPKADRRSTQSTMKSVRMIRHHEICIQGAHPSVPHLPEPATSNELLILYTDPIFFSTPFLPFSPYHSLSFSRCQHKNLRLDHHCKHIRRAALYGWMNGVKSWRLLKMTMKSSEVVFPRIQSEIRWFRAAFISNWSIHDVTPKQLEGLVSTQKIRTKWLAQENIHASKKLLLTIAWPNDSNFTNMRSMQAVQAVRFKAVNAPREASWPDRASLPFCLEN